MFNNKSNDFQREKKIETHGIKIQELEIQLESLDRNIAEFLQQMEIDLEKLTAYMEKPDNFSEQNWEELLTQKKLINDKLQRELNNIRNPIKTKSAYSNLHVERHWLHVR